MSGNIGRRYDAEPKLNMKKVFATLIAILVIIMFIFIIKGLFNKEEGAGKILGTSYFTVFKDNKWGVIDNTGKNIIDPSYQEMIIIPNSKTGVFLCTYDTNYETGEYKTKALNEQNKEIFTEYDKIEAIQNKDKNNNLYYDKEVLKVQKDGKYGLINLKGKDLLALEYEEIEAIPEIENSFKIKKDGKYGIANEEGTIIVKPQYADIDLLGKDNKSGFIIKNDAGLYGIINYSNEVVLEANYKSIQKVFGNDLYVVVEKVITKIVNKKGEDVLTKGFDSIAQILSSQENAAIIVKDNKYGVMNLNKETLIEPIYDDLKETKAGIFIAKKGGKYGIINSQKEEKVEFKYTSIVYNEKADIYMAEDENFNTTVLNSNLEEKLLGILTEFNEEKGYLKLRIDEDTKYYNFKFEERKERDIYPNRTLFISKKDGKYGYVDKDGKVVVEHIYDDALEQNDFGYVAVKQDGKWGSIDIKGKVVQEPTYNLDDYLLIDFIGRWHLGQDINMNYYNQL